MNVVRRLWNERRVRRARSAEAQGQLQQLRGSIAAAVHQLRELGLASGLWREHGGNIPWYALLGEAQSGKSAALRALGFERLAARDGETLSAPLAGWSSGTAVCWELSAELLGPAAGRPDAGATGRELARLRPRRPLDGVLVTLAADQLLALSEAERASSAQRLRCCLELLQQRLERELPVYLLVTKLDALPDFAPFWAQVDPEQCQAPWGASWQAREPEGGSFGGQVAAEWALLGRVLHARALQVVSRSGGRDAAALFGFSQRFAALGERLSSHVHQLTETHACRPRLLLRGFYLCSAHPPCPHSQSSGWFFHQLLERAVVSDRGSAGLPARVLARERLRRRLLLCALLVGCWLTILSAVLSRRTNLELIQSTERSLRELPSLPESTEARSVLGTELEPLRLQLERLERAVQSSRVRHWWGPYAAPELERQVKRRYHERLAVVVHGPVREQLQAELRAVGDVARFDWHNFRQAADTLKLYLMLTQPARLDPSWAAPRLLQSWERARERGACGGTASLQPHVDRWLGALSAAPSLAWPGSDTLVGRVRSQLLSLPVPELGLAWLAEAARNVPAVRAAQVLDAHAARLWRVPLDALVPGMYTRAGWEQLRSSFPQAIFLSTDAWIFDQPLPVAWSVERVQQLHLLRHAGSWRAFFLALGAEARSLHAHTEDAAWGQQDTVERLQLAAQPDAPLARLLQMLAHNVRFPLAPPAEALQERAAGELKEKLGLAAPTAPSVLERDFAGVLAFALSEEQGSGISAGSALAEYQKELRALVASLQPAEAPAAGTLDSAAAQLSRVAATVERLLGTLTQSDRELLEGLLFAPIEDGLFQLRRREQRRLAEVWRGQVVQPLHHLAERFPFRARATEDADLGELQALLAPRTGALWRFVEGDLARRISESDGRFELSAEASSEAALNPALLPCLRAARELREVMFGVEGGGNVAVRLSSAGASAAALSLTVDGLKLDAIPVAPVESAERSGAEEGWQTFTWPGKEGLSGAAIQLRDGPFTDEVRRMGSFGWLRLLLEGNLRARRAAPAMWEASWELHQGQTRVLVELRTLGKARVPSPALFQDLQCPAELFASRPGGPT
ncbi:MAG: hypothetical protein RL685_4401 [Pseudomonadota bacterium]|jgi:type VI secretion system protein ImpL